MNSWPADPSEGYTVSTDSDHSGGDIVFNTDDPDDLDAWLQARLENPDD